MPLKVNAQNIKFLCWERGLSVADLGRAIGKSSALIYRALSRAAEYPGTIALIRAELESRKHGCSNPNCPNH